MAAKQGYVEAQYNLGRMYYLGDVSRGAPEHRRYGPNAVPSHMWFNIGVANGDEEDARYFRDDLERGMTRSQIARAQELALACVASDYEDCEG